MATPCFPPWQQCHGAGCWFSQPAAWASTRSAKLHAATATATRKPWVSGTSATAASTRYSPMANADEHLTSSSSSAAGSHCL